MMKKIIATILLLCMMVTLYACRNNEAVEKLKSSKAGDYIFFGTYEQDNNTQNGKEAIEWLVLEKADNRLLVISKYALDCKQYNTTHEKVTWKDCSLRAWLNNEFMDAAFSNEEKTLIPAVTVSADKNPEYPIDPGNATQDHVFLLSITETEKYLSSYSTRRCKPTDYAIAKCAETSIKYGTCYYWLRTSGVYGRNTYVVPDGAVFYYGDNVTCGVVAVRPAMWIELGE